MIVIPAIDVLDHKVVQLIGGKPGTEKIMEESIKETAKKWVSLGAKYLHLVDLDGAFDKGNNREAFCEIIRTCGVPCEVGGGIRSEEVIAEYVDAGADRIIIGTKGLTDLDWLREMANKFPDKLVLGMDMQGGKIVIKGWQEPAPYSYKQMIDAIDTIPLSAVLFTDVEMEGKKNGIDKVRTREFVTDCPKMVIASGGITSYKDAEQLSRAGAVAAVVGMALYDGTIRPWEWELPWTADYE